MSFLIDCCTLVETIKILLGSDRSISVKHCIIERDDKGVVMVANTRYAARDNNLGPVQHSSLYQTSLTLLFFLYFLASMERTSTICTLAKDALASY